MSREVFHIMVFALLAAFGALARELHTKDHRAGLNDPGPTLRSVISSCVIASFTGTIVYFIAGSIGIMSTNLGYAISGICGWMGPIVLDRLSQFVMDKAGLNITSEENLDDPENKK